MAGFCLLVHLLQVHKICPEALTAPRNLSPFLSLSVSLHLALQSVVISMKWGFLEEENCVVS